ncbi:MAG: N-acetylmuramoyl-L-alanine amidase [Candidatus Zixiibacteriota bacterium]
MYRYEVRFYKGDYRERQETANDDHAVCYVEHHFNSWTDPSADYSLAVVGSNASKKSCEWGRWYAKRVALEFGTKLGGNDGLLQPEPGGRGDGNLYYTDMKAILLEPLFVSNPTQAEIVKSEFGQARLARALVDSILWAFPEGGLVAFSVGHKYKRSEPNDRGAAVYGGGLEAEFAEQTLHRAEYILTDGLYALND